MIALREETNGGYSRSLAVREFCDETTERARAMFSDYRARGVLLNAGFDDDVWRISDEKSTASLMRLGLGTQPISNWIGCTAAEYRVGVKTYITFNLGELAVHTLQDIARELLGMPSLDADGAVTAAKYPNHSASFLQLLPGGSAERDWAIERLSEIEATGWKSDCKSRQRVLADFQSYLRFGDALAEFWTTAKPDEKLFYFPLYFWWNLTAVLPLRVTEFLLTPRDCLHKRGGGYSIAVRRSRLKGGGRKVAYRVNEDYELKTYGLSEQLAQELSAYTDATRHEKGTELGTLLVTGPHYRYQNINTVKWGKRYYTYRHLSVCMQRFREDVIEPRGGNISLIRFGDTRHIAMIGLIITGGSPAICRELAGHADIDVSSHYYSNISNLVECATIERLRKIKGGDGPAIVGERKYPISKPESSFRVTNGFCGSEAFRDRNVSECLKAVGADGQIGDCGACPHFRPDRQGPMLEFGDGATAKAAVDADSRYLMQMTELVRKGMGCAEDIGTALLRLQHSSNRYSICIQEEFKNGETKKTE